jgi:hypothetical protein
MATRQHANTQTRNTPHNTIHALYATRNTQHATRNTQHATRNTQHATRNTQHATRNTQHATRKLNTPKCDVCILPNANTATQAACTRNEAGNNTATRANESVLNIACFQIFKLQLYSLTGVPPDGQKILGLTKGSPLKDDVNLESLAIKDVCATLNMQTINLKKE